MFLGAKPAVRTVVVEDAEQQADGAIQQKHNRREDSPPHRPVSLPKEFRRVKVA
jgi:hypothetical protein